MKSFVRFCGKVKYLGLLGLPSLFFDNQLFNLLLLFWLLGFIEIFYNFPLYLQSFKQLGGLAVIAFRYGNSMPAAATYRCKVKYSLPFKESWTVVNGGVDKQASHSWHIPTQRYAYDFLLLDSVGKSFEGDMTKPASYYCYGKEILAPADGEVIEAVSHHPDSRIWGKGQADCSAGDIRGNYLLLRHAEGEYSLLAHLQPGSIHVKKGDTVKRGQCIAFCGNSGNSSEPHLHFHLQDGESFYHSAGLPVEFEGIAAIPAPNYTAYDRRPIPSAGVLPGSYIVRGRNVLNI